ncbi:hypothetical protein [Legionella waltersii]|uniref:Uncharacterized protein n=1 Tax=Legionella waltersii TaxID=66969 RepID=A0A0W1ANJ8_9GAMM|nr:hypothetical protein [Legionella waltersii]KTD82895.1 hypothetical protein Lwal_0373 [Legionella waltersii]SNV02165.1 Uncharacterised protein [Legionella waltersii]
MESNEEARKQIEAQRRPTRIIPFQAEYSMVLEAWSRMCKELVTDRTTELKAINAKMEAIKTNGNLSFEAKILKTVELMTQSYDAIFKAEDSKLGKGLSGFCEEHLGVVLSHGGYKFKDRGLVDKIFKRRAPIELLPTPILDVRERGVSTAPSVGLRKEPSSLVISSADNLEERVTTGQLRLRGNANLSRLGTMFGDTQFCYAKKPGGVEPGFLAIDLDAEFFNSLAVILRAKNLCPDLLRQIDAAEEQGAEATAVLKKKQRIFSAFIHVKVPRPHAEIDLDQDILTLCGQLEEAVKTTGLLSARLYKLDYPSQGAAKSRKDANKEALREYIGTRLANIFSAKNQHLEIRWVQGPTGPHALLACDWKNGLKELKKFLVGGDGPNYQGVLVADKNTQPQRAMDVPRLGRNLIFCIAIGDRDGIGKNGQNKGIADGEFYGFDYGKPYEGGGVISTLTDDFMFVDPLASAPSFTRVITRHFMYRNFTVFYDNPFSERMFGVHVLRKMITGENPPDEVLESYPSLQQELQRVQTMTPKQEELLSRCSGLRAYCSEGSEYRNLLDRYCFQLATKDYQPFHRYFIEIKVDLIQAAIQHKMPYLELIENLKAIDEMRDIANISNNKILQVFQKRLLLTKNEVDFLDKLEKILSPVSAVSHHGDVVLNHLRFTSQQERIPFQLQRLDDGSLVITTEHVEYLRILESKFGLRMQVTKQGLSGVLNQEQFQGLMRQVDVQYLQKRNELLVEPYFIAETLPGLSRTLNAISPESDKVDIAYKKLGGGNLSLQITVRTKEQSEFLQRVFQLKQPPKLNSVTEITIPKESLPSRKEYIAAACSSLESPERTRGSTVNIREVVEPVNETSEDSKEKGNFQY